MRNMAGSGHGSKRGEWRQWRQKTWRVAKKAAERNGGKGMKAYK